MAKKQEHPSDKGDFKPIERKTLMSFFDEVDRLKEKKDDASMAIAAAYKEHKNAFGLHTKAAKLVYSLKGMDADDRADFLRAFDEYRDTMDLDAQLDLFDGPAIDTAEAPAMAAAGAMH